jgi:hypothetical protein
LVKHGLPNVANVKSPICGLSVEHLNMDFPARLYYQGKPCLEQPDQSVANLEIVSLYLSIYLIPKFKDLNELIQVPGRKLSKKIWSCLKNKKQHILELPFSTCFSLN